MHDVVIRGALGRTERQRNIFIDAEPCLTADNEIPAVYICRRRRFAAFFSACNEGAAALRSMFRRLSILFRRIRSERPAKGRDRPAEQLQRIICRRSRRQIVAILIPIILRIVALKNAVQHTDLAVSDENPVPKGSRIEPVVDQELAVNDLNRMTARLIGKEFPVTGSRSCIWGLVMIGSRCRDRGTALLRAERHAAAADIHAAAAIIGDSTFCDGDLRDAVRRLLHTDGIAIDL